MKEKFESWTVARARRACVLERAHHARRDGLQLAARSGHFGGPRVLVAAVLSSVLGVWLSVAGCVAYGAEAADLLAQFKPDDAVETIQVKLEVGADGEALSEPVALDLGLGFPLWLRAVDQPENTPPFGAVPQQTDAKGDLAPGSRGTYSFSLNGEAGQDVFRTTSQLLAGVHVSDIARIGFGSKGASDWALAGYEIQINGQVLAGAKPSGVKAKAALDAARTRLEEVGKEIGPLLTERTELEDLVSAKLANEADLERLEKVKESLRPLEVDKARCERQLDGVYSWWEDAGFRPPWRQEATVQSAKIVLETAGHEAADTENYVYFRTGGRKYVLTSAEVPLAAQMGPQEFTLDLLAGPLSAADVRGTAVGMLAPAIPFAQTPDRWHPQRVVVQLDDRIVYDSDENSLDQKSLEAVRLIPPAHLDENGKVVVNTPLVRETFVWEAGRGQGLDEATGEILPLPPEDDPAYPGAEPGTMDENTPPEEGESDFPGEDPIDDADMWQGGGGGYSGPGAGFWFWLGWWLAHVTGLDPEPVGGPFNIEHVEMTGPYKADKEVVVKWHVSGDESQISGYRVYLLKMGQNSADPGQLVFLPSPPHQETRSRECTFTLPSDAYYVQPLVVANSPAQTSNTGLARPVLPSDFEDCMEIHHYWTDPPATSWTVSEPVTCNYSILFEATSFPCFVAVDLNQDSGTLRFRTTQEVPAGSYKLVAVVGLQEIPADQTTLTAELTVQGQGSNSGAASATTIDGGTPSPMLLIESEIATNDAGYVVAQIKIDNPLPSHPTMVVSLRLIPIP